MDTELLDVVGMIYDAVLDPPMWETALEAIRARHGWHNASMGVLALPASRSVFSAAINLQSFDEHAELAPGELISMWGGPAHIAQAPLEEPLFLSHQTDPATWDQYTIIREWAKPLGIVDLVGMLLANDRLTYANVAFAQHKSMTEVPEKAVEELRVLAPHLRRAAMISRILEREVTRAATFEAALDAAGSGAVLVRGDMGIVHANASADAMLQSGDPIRSAGGRLRLTDELVPGHLETAVQAAAEGAAAIGRRGIGIPARRRDGSPLVTHVMPLESRLGTRPAADAVVFLADNGGVEPLPTDRLSLLFGLTPAETRIFEMAASGSSPDLMAARLGIAPSTVRTHLQRVYEKTGRHRQAELVALGRELKLLP